MKNFKKMIMGFAAVALIVVGSAFKPASNSKLLTYRYINNGTQYVLEPSADPTNNCVSNSAHQCVITTDENKGSSFNYADLPSDAEPVPGSSEGTYNP
ncbi:hypothetical protein [Pedobacter jeongneungensis]|uniref:hypothetical protein n=1 Tax=Pedobacter jeongneungensis TaxID=947309 RepID=UPI000469C678|nr:hypothetical protein [Pedobacter jeongneungensis]